MKPVTLAIVGAGKRGEAYAAYALQHPDLARVVAVAEPREHLRNRLADQHGVAPENRFASYEDLAQRPRLCDAALVCTQDRMHVQPVEALAPKGYAILLEKPMSPDPGECERIVAAVRRHGNFFAVCHVLLYTELTQALRSLLRAGVIGEVVSLQHLEPVAWWHQAHSFVRGNWRRESESSFMLMSKCCHDIDWLRHVVNRRCVRVGSFGSLRHFRAAEKPAGAADRCLACPPEIETRCPYSAKRLYLDQFKRDWIIDYLNDVITAGVNTREAVEEALRTGPYGRCVYACDNDVVDNQTVMLEYEGGVTASMTMTAFTPTLHRATRIFGTRGYIETDFVKIKVFDFATERETVHDTSIDANSATAASGHGGGDYHLMRHFVHALSTGDTSEIHSGPEATLESHRTVFAAEQARREGRIITLTP
ncbi:MAG: Gfo/Idh/MocA family oxidoreductase [Kiritimatiellia bacterium]